MIRQIRSSERGMHWAPFVVTLGLFLVTVYLWHEASQKDDGQTQTITKLKADLKSAEQKFAPRETRLADISSALGASMVDNTPPAEGEVAIGAYPSSASIHAAVTAFLQKWRDSLKVTFDADKYTATGTGGMVEKLQGNKVSVSYLPASGELGSVTVENAFGMVEAAVIRMQNDIKRYVEENNSVRGELAAARSSAEASLKAKDGNFAELTASKAAAQQQHEARERELTDQLNNSKAALQQAQSEAEAIKSQSETAVAKMQGQLNQVKSELQTAVRKEAPFIAEGTDGAVLNVGSGLVIIDLGKKHMLRPGTVFSVFGKVKGGSLVQKATIKVTVAGTDTADCVILEENPANPITMGDLIASPLFSKDKQLHFVLVGDFKKMGRSQAEGKLKSLGAAIDAQVGATTDYVVIGSPAAPGENLEDSDAVRRAKDYHVTIITEDMLASMTSY